MRPGPHLTHRATTGVSGVARLSAARPQPVRILTSSQLPPSPALLCLTGLHFPSTSIGLPPKGAKRSAHTVTLPSVLPGAVRRSVPTLVSAACFPAAATDQSSALNSFLSLSLRQARYHQSAANSILRTPLLAQTARPTQPHPLCCFRTATRVPIQLASMLLSRPHASKASATNLHRPCQAHQASPVLPRLCRDPPLCARQPPNARK